jgi:hypothetical protein
MDEARSVAGHAVVRAASRREIELARLARNSPFLEVFYQRRDGLGWQPPKELGLAVGVSLLRGLVLQGLPELIIVAGHRVA